MENFLIEIKIYIFFLFHKDFSDFKKSPYLFSPYIIVCPSQTTFDTSSICIHILFGVNLLFNSRITENKNFYLDFFKFYGDFLVIFYFCPPRRPPRPILSFHVWVRFWRSTRIQTQIFNQAFQTFLVTHGTKIFFLEIAITSPRRIPRQKLARHC